MPKANSYLPEGSPACIPSLFVRDAKGLIAFLEKAFGAHAGDIFPGPEGRGVMHARIGLGKATLFVGDENPMMKSTTSNLFLYVKDVDAAFKQAVAAGARSLMPPADQFWGDRLGAVQDPYGNTWQLATHLEDLTPDEMRKRGQEAMKAPRR